MKKFVLVIILLMIIPIITSCKKPEAFTEEKEVLKGIEKSNYINGVECDGYIETIYNGKNTMSIYYLHEYEDYYELIQVESFLSLELLKDLDKIESTNPTSTTTNVLNSLSTTPSTSPSIEEEDYEIDSVKVIYELDTNYVTINDTKCNLDGALTLDSFLKYCEDYFEDELVLISNNIYGLIQELIDNGDIKAYVNVAMQGQNLLMFNVRISLYTMRSNYLSNENKSYYMNMVASYIGKNKYAMFMENVFNETLNAMIGAGPIEAFFYVSPDYSTVYPWLYMYNDDNGSVTIFYNTLLE